MEFNTLSPVIFVDEIEPCVPFWTERLGFENAGEVPFGDNIGFIMLKRGNVTVMYQSYASADDDVPGVAARGEASIALYVHIEDFEAVNAALEGVEVLVPDRKTFYGARETFVRAPCGTVVGFAEMSE